MPCTTPDERWLAAIWPFVRDHMPGVPATVVEIGCGSLGGFVPALRGDGYDAIGVDPRAPEAPAFRRIEFESFELPGPCDVVVACTSLHHVADLDRVADKIRAALRPGGGLVVVVEWAWERFDEASAEWCFARLAPTDPARRQGWLHRRRDEWATSGQPWEAYWRGWAEAHGLHPAEAILTRLDARFDRLGCAAGPYFFSELAGISEQDEQAAIDAGQIQASCIRYVGVTRS